MFDDDDCFNYYSGNNSRPEKTGESKYSNVIKRGRGRGRSRGRGRGNRGRGNRGRGRGTRTERGFRANGKNYRRNNSLSPNNSYNNPSINTINSFIFNSNSTHVYNSNFTNNNNNICTK